jgi:hypothetical protein
MDDRIERAVAGAQIADAARRGIRCHLAETCLRVLLEAHCVGCQEMAYVSADAAAALAGVAVQLADALLAALARPPA